MSEPVEQKRGLLAVIKRNRLLHILISIAAMGLVGWGADFVFNSEKRAEFFAVRAQAYVAIAQFAPWNIAQRYVAIVTTQGNSYAEEFAKKQEQQRLLFRDFACNLRGNSALGGFNLAPGDNPCVVPEHPQGLRAFYLSAYVPGPLRLITAFFDLLFHALIDQGLVGFLVAAAQVALGALLTRLVIRYKKIKIDTFFAYVIGLPLAVLVLGSLIAIPLWVLALGGMMAFKTTPLAALGAQAGGTIGVMTYLAGKMVEVVGHEAIMKQVERVLRS